MPATALLVVPPELRALLGSRFRRLTPASDPIPIALDGTSPVLHLVESAGIPRTEVGGFLIGGRPVSARHLPRPGDLIDVRPVTRPQRDRPQRYLLDVHLGALARRLRLLGLDVEYGHDATDTQLVAAARDGGRVLLTRDRGLLRRRELPFGAFVSGEHTSEQVADVLDRFDPALCPWTRCLACNGQLEPVAKAQVAHLLEPGTMATYDRFSRCSACGRPYWRGAHSRVLEQWVQDGMWTSTAGCLVI